MISILTKRHKTAIADPTPNVSSDTDPATLGTKNPSTVDAKRIFDTSERYAERIPICSLFNPMLLLYLRNIASVN